MMNFKKKGNERESPQQRDHRRCIPPSLRSPPQHPSILLCCSQGAAYLLLPPPSLSPSLPPPSSSSLPPSLSFSPSLSPTSPSDSERNKKSHITPLIGLSGEVTSAGKTAKQFDRREEGRGRKVKHPALARPRRFVSFLFRSQTLGVEHHLNVSC